MFLVLTRMRLFLLSDHRRLSTGYSLFTLS